MMTNNNIVIMFYFYLFKPKNMERVYTQIT
jgi:hypothetical protein